MAEPVESASEASARRPSAGRRVFGHAPIIVSVAALLFSAFTWYRAQVQVRHRLLAMPISFGYPGFADHSEPLKRKIPHQILFINTGNRPVVVRNVTVELIFRNPDERRLEDVLCRPEYAGKKLPDAMGANYYGMHSPLLPAVVQPGQVVDVKTEQEIEFDWDEARYNGTIPICLQVTVLDSEGEEHDVRVPYSRWMSYPEDGDQGSGGGQVPKRLVIIDD